MFDPVIDKEIQNLIDDNIGDIKRLEFIQKSLREEKKIYNSDQKYLSALLAKYSKDEDILEHLDYPKSTNIPEIEAVEENKIPISKKRGSLPQKPIRPLGIKILVILFVISVSYRIADNIFISQIYDIPSSFMMLMMPISYTGLDYIFALSIFLDVIVMIGLYNGKSLVRKFLLILGWIGLILSIIALSPIVIIFGIMVWYLRKPNVKEYFGVGVD